MSDQRNKINCAKCHNAKCTLSGKEMHMAACTGYMDNIGYKTAEEAKAAWERKNGKTDTQT